MSFGNQATEVNHKFPKALLSRFYDLWPERGSKRVENIGGKGLSLEVRQIGMAKGLIQGVNGAGENSCDYAPWGLKRPEEAVWWGYCLRKSRGEPGTTNLEQVGGKKEQG